MNQKTLSALRLLLLRRRLYFLSQIWKNTMGAKHSVEEKKKKKKGNRLDKEIEIRCHGEEPEEGEGGEGEGEGEETKKN